MESLFQTLDKLIVLNEAIDDATGRVNECGVSYWFILKHEPGKALNPKEFAESNGRKGLDVYPCIAYEVSNELNIWGLVVNKELNPIWVDEHNAPLSLLKEHYLGRMPLILNKNEVPGERIVCGNIMASLNDNPFIEVPVKDYERVKSLLNAYNKFKTDLLKRYPEIIELYFK